MVRIHHDPNFYCPHLARQDMSPSPAPNHIHLLVTGGTIDSYFDKKADSNVPSSVSYVRTFLEVSIEPHFTLSQKVICMKDSREITDEDRERMLQEIIHCGHNRILITHGTYTMPITAQFLCDRKSEIPTKVVALTGALYPLARYADSDAGFNLGFAIASLLLWKPGIYIAMNGQLFDGDKVRKDVREARFVALDAV
jgi:L-asparaginase